MANLFNLLKRPHRFEPDTKAFWDDEHISQYMLKAHLDEALDAASRPKAFMNHSIHFIKEKFNAVDYQNVLDLGCGPGLYAKALQESQYQVTGVDLSTRSLDYAKNISPESTFINQDYLTLDFQEDFELALLIYCDYAVMPLEQRLKVLDNIYHALKPGGKLLFDVFTPWRFEGRKETQDWVLEETGGFFADGKHIVFEGFHRYPHNLVLEHFVILDENLRAEAIRNWHQLYTLDVLLSELSQSRFHVVEVLSDVKGTAYYDESETIAVILEKR